MGGGGGGGLEAIVPDVGQLVGTGYVASRPLHVFLLVSLCGAGDPGLHGLQIPANPAPLDRPFSLVAVGWSRRCLCNASGSGAGDGIHNGHGEDLGLFILGLTMFLTRNARRGRCWGDGPQGLCSLHDSAHASSYKDITFRNNRKRNIPLYELLGATVGGKRGAIVGQLASPSKNCPLFKTSAGLRNPRLRRKAARP